MKKFIVEDKDLIEVSIYVKWTDKGPVVLPDVCSLKQGVGLCKGNPEVPCFQKYATCNAPNDKAVCTDEEGRLEAKYSPESLPEGITKEASWWKREDWKTRCYIDNRSTKKLGLGLTETDYATDFAAYSELFVQCLLKDWTLAKHDPRLKLEFIAGDIEIIAPASMAAIKRVSANIMNAFVSKAMIKIRSPGDELKNLRSVP